ncbi:TPA: hypothetical protein ACNVQT_001491 [Citrobacter farmeri]|nr:hypothetical protein [Citrobacter farmeri]
MNRLMEIKSRLDKIEQALNGQHPRFRSEPEVTRQITVLKDYVENERKKIQKLDKQGKLSELETAFIEPAINDVYLSSLDKIRRGSKPSSSVNGYICDTSSTLSYWLHAIEDYERKSSE